MKCFFVYSPIPAGSPRHNNNILPFKITTGSHCTFTQITTQLSAGPAVSLQFLWVNCLVQSHQKQSVNDCPQVIHSVSCCVSVTVCSLLLSVSDSLQLVVMSCCVSVTVCSMLLCPAVCQWQFAACCYVLLCVSDSLQLVVMSCFVPVTVCRLLCPIVWQWQFAACCYVLLCVSDSLQLIVMSCYVSVTVCSLLLYPVLC